MLQNLLLIFAFSAPFASSSPQLEWVRQYDSGYKDYARGIAVDNIGNVVVTGYCDLGGNYSNRVVKYSPGGDTLWVKENLAVDGCYDIATCSSNNDILITGWSYDTKSWCKTGKFTPDLDSLWSRVWYSSDTSVTDVGRCIALDTIGNVFVGAIYAPDWGYYFAALLKYNSNGDLLWDKHPILLETSSSFDRLNVCVDRNQNIIVGAATHTTGHRAIIGKYNLNGDTLWTRSFPTNVGWGLSADSNGNIIVGGYTGTPGYNSDYAIVKCNSAGDSLWERSYDFGSDYECATAVACDVAGNIYATGYSEYPSYSTMVTIKCDPDGNLLWSTRYDPADTSEANDITLDKDKNIVITGTLFANGERDYLTVKYHQVEPDIDIQPDTISFEMSDSTSDTMKYITVSNVGDTDLVVTDIVDTVSWITYINPTNFTVLPGDSQSVLVKASSQSLPDGLYSGYIKIYSNDPYKNPYYENAIFLVDLVEIEMPTLISPSDSSILSDNTPTFAWRRVTQKNFSGFHKGKARLMTSFNKYARKKAKITYELRVICGIDTTVYETQDTIFTIPDTLPDSLYLWQVEAFDETNDSSGYSTPFTLFIDTQPPEISNTTIWEDTSFQGPFPVYSTVTDNRGIGVVGLWYKTSIDTNWISITMDTTGVANEYSAEIPAQPSTDTIWYYIYSEDIAVPPNEAKDPSSAPDSCYSFIAGYTGTEEVPKIPKTFFVIQNHPNPFIGVTEIKYGLPKDANVNLKIYDISGKLVRTLVDESGKPAYYSVSWDGKNDEGKKLVSGIYFIKFKAGDFKTTKKLILVR